MRESPGVMPETQPRETVPIGDSYTQLFWRFLKFGLLAWGGPVAQINMIRQELVDEERWISREHFNRVLAVYQALPGPEAHELCVYFGMRARGRIGGFLAGLAFMLPGFVLMFTLAWFYVTYGINLPVVAALFAGFQAAVLALIVRAVHRIGAHALYDGWLYAIAVVTFIAQMTGLSFVFILLLAGIAYALTRRGLRLVAVMICLLMVGGSMWIMLGPADGVRPQAEHLNSAIREDVSSLAIFSSGLRAGLLTFGGAYTAIPFLQHDAVTVGGWMTNQQFLDGIALGGILPAPLIIFGTFVGYVAGGPLGGLMMTLGIFLPAFGFTLIGHHVMERLISNTALHGFLDGVTAGVVGLIAATALELIRAEITTVSAGFIFMITLVMLYLLKSKAAIPLTVLAGGLLGLVLL
jgi:chromate transporter